MPETSPPAPFRHVAVLGLGLMGGSFAGALRQSLPDVTVTGFDIEQSSAQQALEQALVDRVATTLEAAVADADLVVLAMYVRGILETLPRVGAAMRDGAVLLDLGSTKAEVVRVMDALPERLQAMGGHPMCGKRTSGVEGASPEMYRGRVFVLTPSKRTRPETRERLLDLLGRLEMHPVELDAEHHDRVVGHISHLPHFLAVPVLDATAAADDEKTWELAAGGFRGATAGVRANPAMWRDILLTNRRGLAVAMRALQRQAERAVELLEHGDDDELLRWYQDAQALYTDKLD